MYIHKINWLLFFTFLTSMSAVAQTNQSSSWQVEGSNPEQNAFLLITHRGGVAKGLAHNHVVFAKKSEVTLTTAATIEEGKFLVKIPAGDLDTDSAAVTNKWFPRIKAAGILEEMPGEVSESDRNKIRKDMLGSDQLDIEKFPEITAEVLSLSPKPRKAAQIDATHDAQVRVTIRGRAIVRAIPARVMMTGNSLNVEAFGQFKFTEFNIKPVSLMFGAIQNKDDIDIYVNFTAVKKG